MSDASSVTSSSFILLSRAVCSLSLFIYYQLTSESMCSKKKWALLYKFLKIDCKPGKFDNSNAPFFLNRCLPPPIFTMKFTYLAVFFRRGDDATMTFFDASSNFTLRYDVEYVPLQERILTMRHLQSTSKNVIKLMFEETVKLTVLDVDCKWGQVDI